MRNYIYIIFAVFMLSGCDVEVENPNRVTAEAFWKTEENAREGINAVYNSMNKSDVFSRWMWFRLDLTSDEGFSQSPWGELAEWTRFIYNNYNFSEGNSATMNGCYKGIFRANQVLHYVPNIEFQNESEKDAILGQAYFLRGLYNYYLALLWGSEYKSLAIVLEPSTTGMHPEGHTGIEVYEQAISDFTEAINHNIPEQWTGNDKGRATKGAALTFRAKAYMQLHKWEEAKNDLYWLVEGDGNKYYGLVSDYHDNFTHLNENNIESVFEIQFSDANTTSGEGDDETNPNLGLYRAQFFAPPGIGWTDGELRPWLVTEFKKERNNNGDFDIRLKYTAFYEGMENDFTNNSRIYGKTSNTQTWNSWRGRVFFRKYSSEYYRDFEDYYNPVNVRLSRYADVLLLYAECLAHVSDDMYSAAKWVNKVRSRANMPDLSRNYPNALTNKLAFLKRLQTERVLELSTEGYRWADIKRWGLLDTNQGIAELKSRDEDFSNFVIGKTNVLPIPSDEVKNNINISQNPNY